MIRYLLASTLIFLLLSCSKSELDSEKLFHIKVSEEQITSTLKYSDLIEEVKPIKLETKDSANVLLEIDKVIIDNDKIFILDKFRFQGVMAFDTSGRFLYAKKVGGGAEGEFAHLSGMGVDKKRKELIIFSTPKLLYYSYEGKFLRDKKLDFLANDFETDGEINTFIGQEYGLIVTDNEGKILYKYFDKNKIHPLKFLQPFQAQDKSVFFRHSFNDTIYRVKREMLEKYAIIDFQDKKLNQAEIENLIKRNSTQIPEGKMGRIKYFFDTKNVIYFTFDYNGMIYVAFYDKRTQTTKIIKGNAKEQNDVTLEDTLPYIVGTHENQLIAVVDAQKIFLDLKNLKPNKFSAKIITSFQNKGEPNTIHNPNIILIKLKSNAS
jgi:hypothetical protein